MRRTSTRPASVIGNDSTALACSSLVSLFITFANRPSGTKLAGSRQGNVKSPLQTRDASLASPVPDNTTGQQEQLVLGSDQRGRSSAPNVQQLQNQSANSKQQETTYENDCQLLLNCVKSSFDQRSNRNQNDPLQLSHSMRHPGATAQVQLAGNQGPLGARPQHSGQPGTFPRGQHQNQRVFPVYPMAARAHLNSLRKMENAKAIPGKQPLVEEQPLCRKQPLVERQAEGEALPENPGVSSAYKPGKAAERLNQYMFQQRNRPKDNNIEFWRNLVAEFFAPSATKRCCVSQYKNIKQIDSLFKVAWNCNMCNVKPCCGFEISEELLPRLHKVKYDTGVSEEHLHIESPNEYQGACGQIFLHHPKAAEESVHDQICSWEFCTQNHEEYIPRSSLIPQVCEQHYQLSARDSSSVSPEELQKRTDTFTIHELRNLKEDMLRKCKRSMYGSKTWITNYRSFACMLGLSCNKWSHLGPLPP
ncbi:UNVERIFIED_CONTAM: Transcriptional corepressor SEUSS [Sesamum angustifolium]|uniref:Transcriptional corepressor SEUSS n=1 Tax=Sesamum angustifolium TaxID=2727405 RepID=A0AAW2NIB5_9LAMI